MNTTSWSRKIFNGFYSITDITAWIGYAGLAAIVLLVFVDVCGRYFINSPLVASFELVEQAEGVLAGFAIMYAAVRGGHVALDMITIRLSKRTQTIIGRIFSFIGFGIWAVLAYQTFAVRVVKAVRLSETTSGMVKITTVPVLVVLVLAILLCSLTLLVQTFQPLTSSEDKEFKD